VSVVRQLNREFDPDRIDAFAKNAGAFAPGQPLDVRALSGVPRSLGRTFQGYLDGLPGGVRETLRSVIYYALTSSPPVPITFAWAPAYDTGVTIWEPPCGITVLFQSRYPPGDARAEQMRDGRA
jgi:hypothetical protein